MGALSRRTTVFQGPSFAFVLRNLRRWLTHHFGSPHSHPVDGGRKAVSAGWHERVNSAPSRSPYWPAESPFVAPHSKKAEDVAGKRRRYPFLRYSFTVSTASLAPKRFRNTPTGKPATAEMLCVVVYEARRRSPSLSESIPSSFSSLSGCKRRSAVETISVSIAGLHS